MVDTWFWRLPLERNWGWSEAVRGVPGSVLSRRVEARSERARRAQPSLSVFDRVSEGLSQELTVNMV